MKIYNSASLKHYSIVLQLIFSCYVGKEKRNAEITLQAVDFAELENNFEFYKYRLQLFLSDNFEDLSFYEAQKIGVLQTISRNTDEILTIKVELTDKK